MQKISSLLLTVGVAVTLLGAGCQTNNPPADQGATPSADQGQQTTTAPSTDNSNTSSDFTVTATSETAGTMKVTWNPPADLASDSVVRIVYGTHENPTLPKDYWYQRSSKDMHDATIPLPKAGTYYVRACEWTNNQCARYSNEVQVNVNK